MSSHTPYCVQRYDLTSTSSSWNFILADALVGGESGMSRDFATETGNPKSIAIRFLHHQWKTLHPHCKTCPPTDNKGQAARGGPQVGSLMSSMDYLPGLCFDQRPARKITPLQRVFLRSFMRVSLSNECHFWIIRPPSSEYWQDEGR